MRTISRVMTAILFMILFAFHSNADDKWFRCGGVPLHGFEIVYDTKNNINIIYGGVDVEYNSYNRNTIYYANGRWKYANLTKNEYIDSKGNINISIVKPDASNGYSMVYDNYHDRIILFGGDAKIWVNYNTSKLISLNDTWILKNNKWEKLNNISNDIRPRSDAAMCYSESDGTILLYGGYNTNTEELYDDTWIWDGNKWIAYKGLNPGPRAGHEIVYDKKANIFYMYGGYNYNNYYEDTWVFDNGWKKVLDSGPGGRAYASMVYIEKTNNVMLYGGYNYFDALNSSMEKLKNDTWILANNEWKKVTLKKSPNARAFHSMSINGTGDAVLLGGYSVASYSGHSNSGFYDNNDVWEWNGKEWNEKVNEGPGKREGHAMCYMPNVKGVVLYGGYKYNNNPDNNNYYYNDTWMFKNGKWNKILDSGVGNRVSASMIYDNNKKRVLMHGGYEMNNDDNEYKYVYYGDTFAYSHNKWTKIGNGPKIAKSILLYNNNTLIMIGGVMLENSKSRNKMVTSDDVYVLNVNKWNKIKCEDLGWIPGKKAHIRAIMKHNNELYAIGEQDYGQHAGTGWGFARKVYIDKFKLTVADNIIYEYSNIPITNTLKAMWWNKPYYYDVDSKIVGINVGESVIYGNNNKLQLFEIDSVRLLNHGFLIQGGDTCAIAQYGRDKILVYGGWGGGALNDTWIYDGLYRSVN